MESVGNFEFNRKDLVGHGAFAVVFKGRHKQRHEIEVAVKCINKKNLAKSQSFPGKEIKILKELKHENIVGLLDFQEISGCVYLVMEYCNGGDLAEYLHSKGCLSEDTIRSFVKQIAGALGVLRNKGIVHRDLKPQNILLSHSAGRRVSPNNICIKLADFGFARYLWGNMMAATLCGSPMYMAPEVIMSHTYNAKADLWSVGTIVFQCLTGKAPFQASSPQELRLFYERNQKLNPKIPRETSSHLRHLLLGLLQRNHRGRMNFDEFFHHPFMEASPVLRKSSPMLMPSYASSGSGSSSSGSSTSNLTPTQSDTETQRPHPLDKATPPVCSQLKSSSSSEPDDFVMVLMQSSTKKVNVLTFLDEAADNQEMGTQSGCILLSPGNFVVETPPPSPSPSPCTSPSSPSNYGQSAPVPVPTQIYNYQRMEQNLQGGSRTAVPTSHYCTSGSPRGSFSPSHHRLLTGGSRPYQLSPKVGTIPETPDQSEPQCSRTGMQDVHVPSATVAVSTPRSHQRSSDTIVNMWKLNRRASLPSTLSPTRTMDNLQEPCVTPTSAALRRSSVKRCLSKKLSSSVGRLSDIVLKAVFGSQLDRGSYEGLSTERSMDTTAPPGGIVCVEKGSGIPGRVLFTVGTPPDRHTPPTYAICRHTSASPSSLGSPGRTYNRYPMPYISPERHCCGFTDIMAPNLHGDPDFVPPELQAETLMEQGHTDMLTQLRFTLAFTQIVTDIAVAKDSGNEKSETSDASFLEQSQVADQISQLSREWSCAEQLVLYMTCAELLFSTLHMAKEAIKQGKLYPSASVKQVVRKLNDLYKECVTSSRSLTANLQLFFSTKQRLMDRMNNITAEKIIYFHTVQMVQAAALDEMFHHGEASVERYQKALLLMEGLSLIITETSDLDNINKCIQCIERRLSSLQPGLLCV
ncbi:serine/threonine-protein kinase ULK1a isoform X2 [Silurus meridionalis]|uniref:serine/threonine-protein kinase ULK1a isoform X2 n=1 Tax=Silurus meridionalis TaxID=175797 RepID=UPI001EEAA358|nr:serine/threonine-protein kinase ULK1a isoform X2 [Silurus meridionalis]